ncbi:hypothetical protein TNCV_4163111 [Trichonephila clavipes]|nr:hypothetical protein TNCV_4163111 [Trichonephila clavipes]
MHKEIAWLDNIMNECANSDLVKHANKPVLLADNQAAIDFLKSPIENYSTKHIECTASPEVLTNGGRIQMDVVQDVTLLTASNWEVWKVEARASLMHYGAWEFIKKGEERSPEGGAKLSWRDQSDLKLRKYHAFFHSYISVFHMSSSL